MKPELAFTYDAQLNPIAGKCTRCKEQITAPPSSVTNNLEVIMWLSKHFLEHKALKHSTPTDIETAD